jgi:hypothetical protein
MTRVGDPTAGGLFPERAGFSLPPDGTLKDFWAGVDFAPARRRYPAAAAYRKRLQQLYSEAAFASFEVPPAPAVRWYLARGRPDEVKFFDRFWRAPSVRAAFPALGAGRDFRCREPFQFESSFALDGELAAVLFSGGCYSKFQGTPTAAMQVGRDVSRNLIGERYNEVYLFRNHGPWCGLFEGMATWWTVVVVDLREALIHVLYAADVD